MNNSNKIIISIVIAVLIAAVVGWVWYSASQNNQEAENSSTSTITPSPLEQQSSPAATESENSGQAEGIVKEVEVTNSGLNFTPKTITVNRGDVVRVIFTSVGDTHTFTLPEFNVDTGNVDAGEQKTVEFVAAAPGSFEFYCTPHRDMGMTGTLIVQ